MGAAEDIVAVLDLQLLQIVLDDAQQQPEVRHREVVLALQIHKVALVCTGRQPQSAGASHLLFECPSAADNTAHWYGYILPCPETQRSIAAFSSAYGAVAIGYCAAITGALVIVLLMVWRV